MTDPDLAAHLMLAIDGDVPFIQRPAELLNRYAGVESGGQPSEEELLATLVPIERAIDAAPPELASPLHDLATPLRRFLVAHRTGEVLTVGTERMVPALMAVLEWFNSHGYRVANSDSPGGA